MALRARRRAGGQTCLNFVAFACIFAVAASARATPAPPPMAEPPSAAPAPAPPPMVSPMAPAAPLPAPSPARPTVPRPDNGAGAIIGGSILTGVGGALLFAGGIGCAVACGRGRDVKSVFLGVMAGGAAAIGGGVGLEVVGFQRLDAALEFERQYGMPAVATPRRIAIGSMLGGFFISSFFGLISGGITHGIYKRRWTEARLPASVSSLQFGWSPSLSRDTRGLSFGGRF